MKEQTLNSFLLHATVVDEEVKAYSIMTKDDEMIAQGVPVMLSLTLGWRICEKKILEIDGEFIKIDMIMK